MARNPCLCRLDRLQGGPVRIYRTASGVDEGGWGSPARAGWATPGTVGSFTEGPPRTVGKIQHQDDAIGHWDRQCFRH